MNPIIMDELKIIEIKKSVFADNEKDADALRQELKAKGVFLLNLMSAPGSGKTTTLVKVINRLKDNIRIAVMSSTFFEFVILPGILADGTENVNSQFFRIVNETQHHGDSLRARCLETCHAANQSSRHEMYRILESFM